ncbi:Levanase precursor [Botrimarina colliarenosi]|uniref:Levanase n=1 Tax=Botrimarina colliarenosi TaxID=2528001 RepID=A0A5C6AF28_9BACT|nr:glycoside hydrolase family 32 protein [Botrimarina colliarenosi]TWT97795.1 Levanase precursor [Botrimarina colliarenosi]
MKPFGGRRWLLVLVGVVTAAASPAQTTQELAQGELAKLQAYRSSDEYLREPWRPRVHFTPERNWMNDPNGLVFYRGEYHLFYQHNPLGIDWGHMSWGHAVSRDLMHWEPLPIALWEEGDEMIFSGSCVVDHRNTSGFGTAENPPLVAVYTSHRPGNQSQSLAYSTDAGRTWTKHAGNPVIDLDIAEFRDPKVFWHAPTEKWVMVVALSAAKRVQLYGSPDLNEWRLLSEFGPAGVEGKSNWECPDLFELPIVDSRGEATDETRWVLEADFGGGGVGGGSGNEYFVGRFDGNQFTCDDPQRRSQQVDYGRDFYAPVTWSDLPAEDGRRVWIGWMTNLQTNGTPTSPWRSAMTIPRSLTLRETGSGLRLAQAPVRELESLREDAVDGTNAAVRGKQLDIVLEVTPDAGRPLVLHVLEGPDETTRLVYDPVDETLSVDRRDAGFDEFHDAFAGVYPAPIALDEGRLRLRVVVDRSSVEVFAQDGVAVLTTLVFPGPESDGVRLDAPGAEVHRFTAWPLRSALTER